MSARARARARARVKSPAQEAPAGERSSHVPCHCSRAPHRAETSACGNTAACVSCSADALYIQSAQGCVSTPAMLMSALPGHDRSIVASAHVPKECCPMGAEPGSERGAAGPAVAGPGRALPLCAVPLRLRHCHPAVRQPGDRRVVPDVYGPAGAPTHSGRREDSARSLFSLGSPLKLPG